MEEKQQYFEEVLRNRYSCRKFKDDMVPEESIKKILEMGRLAPTAKNKQPFHIYVVTKVEGLAKIDEVSPCRYNAPLVFIVCASHDEAWSDGVSNSFEMDASIVATHMLLEASNIGVDNIWVEMFDRKKTKEVFNIPEGLMPVILLPMGYSDTSASPMHNTRKTVEELVTFI